MLELLEDIDVVGSAGNGAEAIELVAAEHPDAILLDLHMPVLDGIEATRQLTEQHPEVAIVVLTTYLDNASILAAFRAGARSYLTKDADRSDLALALRSAVKGLSVLDSNVQSALIAATIPSSRRLKPAAPAALPDGLTPREGEILTMIAQGLSNPDIASQLHLSTHTVKSHINRIFAKTASSDRTAAIRYACAHNLA